MRRSFDSNEANVVALLPSTYQLFLVTNDKTIPTLAYPLPMNHPEMVQAGYLVSNRNFSLETATIQS